MDPHHLVIERRGIFEDGAHRSLDRFLLGRQCSFLLIHRRYARQHSFSRPAKTYRLDSRGDFQAILVENLRPFSHAEVQQTSRIVLHFIDISLSIASQTRRHNTNPPHTEKDPNIVGGTVSGPQRQPLRISTLPHQASASSCFRNQSVVRSQSG